MRKCREAIELLSIIAVVGNLAWRPLLQIHCHCAGVEVREILPRFCLQFSDTAGGEECVFDTLYYSNFFYTIDRHLMGGSGSRFERALNDFFTEMTPEMRLKLQQSGPRNYPTTLSLTPSRALESAREYLANVRTLVKGIAEESNRTQARYTRAQSGTSDGLMDDDDLKYVFSFVLNRAEIGINHLAIPRDGTAAAMVEFLAIGVQISPVIDLYHEWTVGLRTSLISARSSRGSRLPRSSLELRHWYQRRQQSSSLSECTTCTWTTLRRTDRSCSATRTRGGSRCSAPRSQC